MRTYRYWNDKTKALDVDGMVEDLEMAAEGNLKVHLSFTDYLCSIRTHRIYMYLVYRYMHMRIYSTYSFFTMKDEQHHYPITK